MSILKLCQGVEHFRFEAFCLGGAKVSRVVSCKAVIFVITGQSTSVRAETKMGDINTLNGQFNSAQHSQIKNAIKQSLIDGFLIVSNGRIIFCCANLQNNIHLYKYFQFGIKNFTYWNYIKSKYYHHLLDIYCPCSKFCVWAEAHFLFIPDSGLSIFLSHLPPPTSEHPLSRWSPGDHLHQKVTAMFMQANSALKAI